MEPSVGGIADLVGKSISDIEALFIAETLKVTGFEHAVDEDGSLWSSYEITTQPSFVFINDDGQASTHVGALGVAGLQERLDALLAG